MPRRGNQPDSFEIQQAQDSLRDGIARAIALADRARQLIENADLRNGTASGPRRTTNKPS